jgi:thioredoxin-like negative regulator of GroEL
VATKQAAAEGKFIVLDISASWCPPCQEMTRAVYPSSEFIEFSKTQVFMLASVSQMLSSPSTGTRVRGPSFNIAPGSPLQEGAAALTRGENDKALTLLTAVLPRLTNQQDKDQATLMLAVTYMKLGRWKEARSFLADYLKNHPEDLSAKTMLEAVERIEKQ